MKILFITVLTAAAIITFNYSNAGTASFDGNCSIGISDEEKKDRRFIGSYINLFESDKILIFRINDRIKSIFLSPDVKWEFSNNSPVKKAELLKGSKGLCIAIDFEIQNEKKIAKKIKILPDNRTNRRLSVKYEELANLKKNKAVFIDSRPDNIFSNGTIPGSINISFAKLKENSGKKLLPEDKNTQLVFFCSGHLCNVSNESAIITAKAGYKNVKVFQGGFPEYLKNENVYAIQPSYLQILQERKKPHILIDIRKNPSEEHIPGAFSIDKAKIDDLKAQLPQKPDEKINAMIIVYSSGEDNDKTALESAVTIHSWGYKNVSILTGGFKSYVKSGTTEKNSLLKKIQYSKEESFFIPVNEFYDNLVKNSYKDYTFIDLRDDKDILEEPAISALGALKLSYEKLYLNQPKNKFKKYIIYSDSFEKSIDVREQLLLENFKHIQVIDGYIFSDGKGGLLIGDKKAEADLVRKLKR